MQSAWLPGEQASLHTGKEASFGDRGVAHTEGRAFVVCVFAMRNEGEVALWEVSI